MTKNHEIDYQRSLLAKLSLEFRDYRFLRRNVGLVRMADGRMFRTGIPGQCDLEVIKRGGKHGELEVKRFTKLNEDQEKWRDWCREWEIPWLLVEASKKEDPPITVDRWVSEVREWLATW